MRGLTSMTGVEPAREGYLPVRGAQLYFRDLGAGPSLVVLHGGPDFNHNYLLPELDRLSAAFRLIYYDQRGRGKSSRDVTPESVDLESEIDDLDKVREHFGLVIVALLGHSWGGLLAMEYATRHPERVSHLVLVNTAPASHADLLLLREQRRAEDPGSLAKKASIASTTAYANGELDAEAEYYRAHFSRTLGEASHLESIVGRLRSHFTPEDVLKARAIEERLYAQTWSLPEYDLVPRLRQLKMPLLLIHGDRDFVPLECARHIANAVPESRLVVLGECGHFSYLERPEEVCNEIVSLFTQRPPGPAGPGERAPHVALRKRA